MKFIDTISNIDFTPDGKSVSLDKFLEIYNKNYAKLNNRGSSGVLLKPEPID